MAIPVGGMATHQRQVSELIGGLQLDEGLPALQQPQQVEVSQAQTLPTGFAPRLVEVVRQQIAGVQLDRGERGRLCRDQRELPTPSRRTDRRRR